jgi:hypothetical protein
MSVQVFGFDGQPFNQFSTWAGGDRFVETIMKLVFSGSYVAGGDALDLSNAGGTPTAPSTFPPAVSRGGATFDIEAHGPTGSRSANGGYYTIVAPNADAPLTFADLASMKIKIFSGGGTELSPGAYPADVLADNVIIKVVYAR